MKHCSTSAAVSPIFLSTAFYLPLQLLHLPDVIPTQIDKQKLLQVSNNIKLLFKLP